MNMHVKHTNVFRNELFAHETCHLFKPSMNENERNMDWRTSMDEICVVIPLRNYITERLGETLR